MVRGLMRLGIAAALAMVLASALPVPSAQAQAENRKALEKEVQLLDEMGKYAEALARQRVLAADIEKAELASAGKPGEETAGALGALAWHALFAREFDQALAASERAHALAPDLLLIETNHAHALLFLGRVDEARALYLAHKGEQLSDIKWEDAIADDFDAFRKAGLDHAALEELSGALEGTSGQSIDALHKAGKYTEAVARTEQYVAFAKSRYGEDHPQYATALNQLGVLLYENQDRYAEAERLYKRSLAIYQEALGPDDPNVGTVLYNLAGLYIAQGRYADAGPLYKRALAIKEPAYPDVGRALNGLAVWYDNQGKGKDAEPLYQRAVIILEKLLGPDHLDVGITRENLGDLYKSQGRLPEAEPLLKRALEIKEKVYGPDNYEVAYLLGQLADLYRLQGKCNEAEPLFRRQNATYFGPTAADPDPKKVSVLFATDRERDAGRPSVTFGGERARRLSFGRVIVAMPFISAQMARAIASGKGLATARTLEERRIAMNCIEVLNDTQIVEEAARRLGDAKTYPNQAFMFVHGYNVSFEDALRRAAQIAYDIKFDGGTFLFSWPSRERLWGYLSDLDSVLIAADHLKEFLEKIVSETKVTKIHFIAHSMGNTILLLALDKMADEGSKLRPVIGEIIDAAPDVDPAVFEMKVKAIKAKGGNFTLYASRGDWPLRISGWLRGLARSGFISGNPLIVSDIETIDITNAGTNLFALNHDLYVSSPILVADIRRIIERSERPPDKRTKEFERMDTKEGTYWRLRTP